MTIVKSKMSRRSRKKEAIRSQIIAAAIELFSQHGISGVTVDQIAEAADVGKGTIYNYFQTKEDIVVAFMTAFEGKVQAKLRDVGTSRSPLAEVLTEFIRLQFKMKKRYHPFVRVFFGQMFLHTDQFLPYMAEIQKTMDPQLQALLRDLQQRGAIRPDINISDLIVVFKTVHLGLTALWAIEGPPFTVTEQTLVQEIRLLCEGLEVKQR
jgi:AcrR family transcriptional regulator